MRNWTRAAFAAAPIGVLDETRLESRRFVIAGTPRRLGDAIEAALMVVEPAARQKGIQLDNVVAAYGAEGAYLGDEGRVRQILINVIGNAVKFTPGGGIVKVSAGLAESVSPEAQVVGPGPWVYVRVEDTGPGIAREEINAIFEPFEQGATDPSVAGVGAGLGLAISRRLARLMGGDVTVRSEFGEGATFFIWLPASDETLMR